MKRFAMALALMCALSTLDLRGRHADYWRKLGHRRRQQHRARHDTSALCLLV